MTLEPFKKIYVRLTQSAVLIALDDTYLMPRSDNVIVPS